jgi:DHA3 family tetracycline resistance protein-like MFS transporter
MGATLLTIGVVEVIRRRVDTNSHRSVTRTLFAATALLTVSVIVFGLVGNFALALGVYWLITVIRGVSSPLYIAWVNQSTDARVRATVLSMTGQADAFGQIAGGPIVGAIGLYAGLSAALVTAGAALSPALLLFARALGQGEQTPPLVGANANTDANNTASSNEPTRTGEPVAHPPALNEQAAPPAKEAQPVREG